jgi:hypothetical protein
MRYYTHFFYLLLVQLSTEAKAWLLQQNKSCDKVKVRPRTGHEGPEGK